jgi:hypothetical protein
MKQKVKGIIQDIVAFVVALDYSPTENLYREIGRMQQEVKRLKGSKNLKEKDLVNLKTGNPLV